MNEIWKTIPLMSEKYEVSNLGRIRTKKSGLIRKTQRTNQNYEICTLNDKKRTLTSFVHRYVAITFIPNPKNDPVVNHKNGIKYDNCVDNLEWVTLKENSQHAVKTGLVIRKFGENNSYSKLKENEVLEIIKRFQSNELVQDLAKEFKVNINTIYCILQGKTWKHLNNQNLSQAKNLKTKLVDQNGIVYNSYRDAEKRVGINRLHIYQSVHRNQFRKGYKFSKLIEENNGT